MCIHATSVVFDCDGVLLQFRLCLNAMLCCEQRVAVVNYMVHSFFCTAIVVYKHAEPLLLTISTLVFQFQYVYALPSIVSAFLTLQVILLLLLLCMLLLLLQTHS
jgi:hypothetical protein